RKVTFSFHLRPDERLYGLGEKFLPLNQMGQRIVSWTRDALGSTSEKSHKNIPLLWSTRGYGLFIDSTARITWELGTVSCQSATITIESENLDLYLIYGPSPAEILQHYAELTGHAPLPPKWSFGLWVSSGGTYRNQTSMERLLDGLEEHNLPADVVHIDPWWMNWRQYCDFRWNRDAFPEIEKFIEALHNKDLKLCLWIQPYISVESDLFEHGRKNDYFLKKPDGDIYVINYGLSLAPRPDGIIRTAGDKDGWNAPVAIVDFSKPEAADWYRELMKPVLQDGVDVFKTDFGEDVPEDTCFSNGQTGRTMHNLYPLLYTKTVFDTTWEVKGYAVVWARSGWAGSQNYPVCWSADPAADWASLAATIRGGLSIGMSGIPFWSNDIGGYRGMPEPELYIRWAQFGLFCSHSRMHGDSPREPWHFGAEALDIVQKYVNLRYRLFPYLYSTAIDSSRSGMPVIRAMPLAFPDDPNAHDKDLQYMLGESILVAPVYDRSRFRTVYFPAGEWIDMEDGNIYRGPDNIKVPAPLHKLPLFVRRGTILPMMNPAMHIPQEKVDPLILHVYPDSRSSYNFWEDNGVSRIRCEKDSQNIVFKINAELERSYVLKFWQVEHFSEIILQKNGINKGIDPKTVEVKDDFLTIKLARTKAAGIIILL
ncbi:MAG: glycoside hydrolase family 31 protein, partial [Calditrichia bacterium]